jgi:hypothetical protein
MRWFSLMMLTGCLAFSGCRRADLVEAELRTRERELRETRSELFNSEAYNQALQSEIRDVRKESCSKLTPERASQIYTIRGAARSRWPRHQSAGPSARHSFGN